MDNIRFTIKETTQYQTTIKNSIFIANLYPIKSIDNVESILSLAKKEHKKATHVCYGYSLCNNFGFSDDGEPSSTAGKPILSTLKGNNLEDVLAVVIRYYGGIKLGTGGLVRAYSGAVQSAIKLTQLIEKHDMKKLSIECGYDDYPKIKDVLTKNNCVFLNSEFFANVFIIVEIESDKFNEIIDKITNINHKILLS